MKFNQGNGLWSDEHDLDFKNFNWSESYNESLDIGITLGVTVMSLFKVTGGVSATPYSSGSSRDRMQLADINGDGLPDLVTSSGETQMTVRYNKSGKTNLLKTVKSFTGSRIHLDYTLSPPSVDQPSRQWQLTMVTTKDPLNPNGGDTSVTAISYQNPHYDRLERTFYGYGVVVTSQKNPASGAVLRSVRQEFHNGNILVKGRPRKETTTDGSGRKYMEKVYRYGYKSYNGTNIIDSCSGNAYSFSDRVVTRHYDSGAMPSSTPTMTTAERYEYDEWHNVKKYYDEGDTAYSDDGLRVDFTYRNSPGRNMTGLRSGYRVYATSGASGWMRRDTCVYDIATGSLTQRTFSNSSGMQSSVYNYWYNVYGNMDSVKAPTGSDSKRMTYHCTYDSPTHTYPVKVKNSYKDSVVTVYDLVHGKPVSVTDPTGSVMQYTYDLAGRPLTVRSPLNNSINPSLKNEYFPPNHTGTTAPTFRPYAVTWHYDDDGAMITKVVVLTDGFGRVVQTKKGITANNQAKLQSSGREVVDALGRVIKQYDPVIVDSSSNTTFDTLLSATPQTTKTYDILDRELSICQPSFSYTTTKTYSVANDASGRRRFRTQVTDPNNHTTTVFSDHDGRQVQVTDAEGGITRSVYDALGQLARVTDPEGFLTEYYYDKLGRLTSRVHPDAGTTQYTYDAAGNLTSEVNPLGTVSYVYSYNRMTHKNYSVITENSVTYTYGTTGTGRGRIVGIEDGTGTRTLTYDALGNVVSETRVVAIPDIAEVYSFTTDYTYDSWGRMLNMTYPDNEIVTYGYLFGGDLFSMSGHKGNATYKYIDSTVYNDFGQKIRIKYGNGAVSTYVYDQLHRLASLRSKSASGALMQSLAYTIDGVGNIGSVQNTALAIGTLGGEYTNTHTYDGLDRLTFSTETVNNRYSLDMEISPSGRLAYKNQVSTPQVQSYGIYHYGYCDDNKPHAPRRVYESSKLFLYDLNWDGAGNLAQVNTVIDDEYNGSRFLFWTEDSRLHTVVDDEHYSYYAYDHAGERTLKITGTVNGSNINGGRMFIASALDNITVYPSPYLVVSDRGYTKHYYSGSERVAARIGGGGLSVPVQNGPGSSNAEDLFDICKSLSNGRVLTPNDPECVQGINWNGEAALKVEIMGAPTGIQSDVTIRTSDLEDNMAYYSTHTDAENEAYYYHSDHLGSASWITDVNGQPVQHLCYLPYGEPFVNQRVAGSTYSERYTFTGKELDAETGYSYFGARYYDSGIPNIFLSVDPMSDKYPSISPYAYCAWNPVKLVDPDGEEIWIGTHDSKYPTRYDPNKKYETGSIGDHLNKIYKGSKAGRFVIDQLINGGSNYYISDSQNPDGESNPCYDGSTKQIYLNTNKHGRNEGTISHELFHAFQQQNGQYGISIDCEVEAFIFEGIVLQQINDGKMPTRNQMSSGMISAFKPYNPFNNDHKKYGNHMISLTHGFNEQKMDFVVNNFSKCTIEGERYAAKGYSGTWNGERYSAKNSLLSKYKSNIY